MVAGALSTAVPQDVLKEQRALVFLGKQGEPGTLCYPSNGSFVDLGSRCLDLPDAVFRDRRGSRLRWSAHDTSQNLADHGFRQVPDDSEDIEDLVHSEIYAEWLSSDASFAGSVSSNALDIGAEVRSAAATRPEDYQRGQTICKRTDPANSSGFKPVYTITDISVSGDKAQYIVKDAAGESAVEPNAVESSEQVPPVGARVRTSGYTTPPPMLLCQTAGQTVFRQRSSEKQRDGFRRQERLAADEKNASDASGRSLIVLSQRMAGDGALKCRVS